MTTNDIFNDMVDDTIREEQTEQSKVFEKYVINLAELATVPDAHPVITGIDNFPIIYNGASTAIITAESGVGKTSFLATALFGDFAPKDVNVLWIDTEQPTPALKRVAYMIASQQGCNLVDIKGFNLLSLRKKATDEFIDVMDSAIKHYHPTLVVMDNIADAITDGTTDTEIRYFLNSQLFPTLDAYNIGFLGVVHKNKDGKIKGHIGSITFEKSDICIEIAKDTSDTDKRIVKHIKNRYGKEQERAMKFNDNGVLNWIDDTQTDVLPVDLKDFVTAYLPAGAKYRETSIRAKYDEWQTKLDYKHKPVDGDVWGIKLKEMLVKGYIVEDGKSFGKYTYKNNINA